MISKIAEADARIAELEIAVAGVKAETLAETKNLNTQLRLQRRLNSIIQAIPPDPVGLALVALIEADRVLTAKGK